MLLLLLLKSYFESHDYCQSFVSIDSGAIFNLSPCTKAAEKNPVVKVEGGGVVSRGSNMSEGHSFCLPAATFPLQVAAPWFPLGELPGCGA